MRRTFKAQEDNPTGDHRVYALVSQALG
jgi:hypothetical protein